MLDIVSAVDIFEGLPRAELERLVASGEVRSFPASSVLMRQGEPGNSVHVVLRGRVRVLRSLPEVATPLLLAELGPGQAVGEMAVMTGEPRTATVTAAEDTQTLELDGKTVAATVSRFPKSLQAYLHVLQERARRTDQLLAQVDRTRLG